MAKFGVGLLVLGTMLHRRNVLCPEGKRTGDNVVGLLLCTSDGDIGVIPLRLAHPLFGQPHDEASVTNKVAVDQVSVAVFQEAEIHGRC